MIDVTSTIRFSHVDAAGIIFFPRYFEMLLRNFAGSPLAHPPFTMRTEFRRPNRLGDKLTISARQVGDEWSYSGELDGIEHFSVVNLPDDVPNAMPAVEQKSRPGFRTEPEVVGSWTADPEGVLHLSRYFELVSDTVEMWMESALGVTFHTLHIKEGFGIPTARMTVQLRELPRVTDEICMTMQAVAVGRKSLTLRSRLLRGEECLVDNEQVVVFVAMQPNGYSSIVIPDDIRARLQEQVDAAA